MSMNRLHNCLNPHQGEYKKVLCCCSAGLLRSPTAAFVLSQEPFNCNTRSVGLTQDYGLILIDQVLIHWADEFVVMDRYQRDAIKELIKGTPYEGKPVVCLDIPDNFAYRDPELMRQIVDRYTKAQGVKDDT